MDNRTFPQHGRGRTNFGSAAVRLATIVLSTLVGISRAASPEGREHLARQASLTFPTVSLTDPTESVTGSVSILPISTTTTALTTSSGPDGTSTFLTTFTTLAGPGPSNVSSTSGNVSVSQTTTSTAFPSLGSYSPCVDNCLQLSVSAANCSTVTEPECYCVSAAFTSTLVQCVSEQCMDDLSSAEHLGQAFCNLASSSISLAFPAPSVTPSAPTSASSATSGTVSASASASENAALSLRLRIGYGHGYSNILGLWSLSAVGIAFGAYLIC